jgi:crotonobetainyl-CoA:carnitine CoA-transferase CaiB-like acyl-CoA transferase
MTCLVQRVTTPDDALKDKHWIDRGDIVDVLDPTTGTFVKQIGVVPNSPRPQRKFGEVFQNSERNTKRVLKDLAGLSEEELAELKRRA